jgi:hypothetical protein
MRVPADAVFVLGDNYGASIDSRQIGPIPMHEIIGRAHLTVDATKGASFECGPRAYRRRWASEEQQPDPGV